MGNRTGASFGGKPEVSPRKKRAIARRKRVEEKAWQNKSGEVKTVYRCICDKNPEACKADVHGQKNLSIFFPFEKNIQIKVLQNIFVAETGGGSHHLYNTEGVDTSLL